MCRGFSGRARGGLPRPNVLLKMWDRNGPYGASNIFQTEGTGRGRGSKAGGRKRFAVGCAAPVA